MTHEYLLRNSDQEFKQHLVYTMQIKWTYPSSTEWKFQSWHPLYTGHTEKYNYKI